MINSRSLDELTPDTRDKAKALIAGCLLEGVDFLRNRREQPCDDPISLFLIASKADNMEILWTIRAAFGYWMNVVNAQYRWVKYIFTKIAYKILDYAHGKKIGLRDSSAEPDFFLDTNFLNVGGVVRPVVHPGFVSVFSSPLSVIGYSLIFIFKVVLLVSTSGATSLCIWVENVRHKLRFANNTLHLFWSRPPGRFALPIPCAAPIRAILGGTPASIWPIVNWAKKYSATFTGNSIGGCHAIKIT